MNIGAIVLVFILAAFLGMVALQVWLARQAMAMQGKPAPRLAGELGELASHDALLFFHSPTCGPCRAMAPHVDALAREDGRVRSIDVTRDPQVAAAFRVMATPTTVAIHGGTIAVTRLGAMPPSALKQLAEGLG